MALEARSRQGVGVQRVDINALEFRRGPRGQECEERVPAGSLVLVDVNDVRLASPSVSYSSTNMPWDGLEHIAVRIGHRRSNRATEREDLVPGRGGEVGAAEFLRLDRGCSWSVGRLDLGTMSVSSDAGDSTSRNSLPVILERDDVGLFVPARRRSPQSAANHLPEKDLARGRPGEEDGARHRQIDTLGEHLDVDEHVKTAPRIPVALEDPRSRAVVPCASGRQLAR